MTKFWQRLTNWEQWPFFVVYSPLLFLWIYYSIRARHVWYFSPVNPGLEFSGFEGEGKKEMYDLMASKYYPPTTYIHPLQPFNEVLLQLKNRKLTFPLVVKPDRGMQGILFRVAQNEAELKAYHQQMPVSYVVQGFVDLPLEFSVFHIRYPGQPKGILTGFILKEFFSIKGDGSSDIASLIAQHPKAAKRQKQLLITHKPNLNCVLPVGQKYYLSYAGNHNQGAKFVNLCNEIDDRLRNQFDEISNECQSFYYGRYDLKCSSIDDLKAGKNFSILEFNGAGAEPNHIYDCNMTYPQALKEIAMHWKYLYQIGKINNFNGVPYWSFNKGWRYLKDARKMFSILRQHDTIT